MCHQFVKILLCEIIFDVSCFPVSDNDLIFHVILLNLKKNGIFLKRLFLRLCLPRIISFTYLRLKSQTPPIYDGMQHTTLMCQQLFIAFCILLLIN